MTLKEGCQFIQTLTGVPLTILHSTRHYEDFCRSWQFHKVQEYLCASTLHALSEQVGTADLICTTDCFQVRFIFFTFDHRLIAFGPYRSEVMTESDCSILLKSAGLTQIPIHDVCAYRSPFQILTEEQALHYINSLLISLDSGHSEKNVLHMEHYPHNNSTYDDVLRPHTELILERYQTEQQLMENIRRGNCTAAIKNWRALHDYVDYLKQQVGETMEVARIAAAITRTIIRIAAMQVGIPPLINDRISGQSNNIVRNAKTIAEINREHERLIREYCKMIRRQQEQKYSMLVLSAVYYIEHEYTNDISIHEMAEELNVSVKYLIGQFRKETGQTPNSYLCNIRLKKAEHLLLTTPLAIQDIGAKVGILDANYFAKLFKRQYGETPSNHRKKYKL